MSFLKRFFKKKAIIGKVIYGLDSQEVGEISKISEITNEKNSIQAYEVTTKDSKMKLKYPISQFFTDETGRLILLPDWCYQVRVSCSRLLKLEKRYKELNNLRATLEPKSYKNSLVNILKNSSIYVKIVIRYLPKFEELLVDLAKEKTGITDETTRLMTRRLLEYGRQTYKTAPTSLDRKQYSLKIIDLRNKYTNISNLIYFVTELYDNTKASSKFFENLLKSFGVEKEAYPKKDEEIEDLTKRAKALHYREVEVIGILDSLMESLIS
jgi:hypothetical protein